jgi:hypothetical protein
MQMTLPRLPRAPWTAGADRALGVWGAGDNCQGSVDAGLQDYEMLTQTVGLVGIPFVLSYVLFVGPPSVGRLSRPLRR